MGSDSRWVFAGFSLNKPREIASVARHVRRINIYGIPGEIVVIYRQQMVGGRGLNGSGMSVSQGRGEVLDQAQALVFFLLVARDVTCHRRGPDYLAGGVPDG
jgi:hypothetical protein